MYDRPLDMCNSELGIGLDTVSNHMWSASFDSVCTVHSAVWYNSVLLWLQAQIGLLYLIMCDPTV